MPEITLKPGWKILRFDQMAYEVKDRIERPIESGLDRYVGLEHLDAGSLKISRWGSTADVEKQKLIFKSGDIIFGRRNAYLRRVAVADFDGVCSAHAMVLRAKENVVLPSFLPFFMQTNMFWDAALKVSAGSMSPTINWSNIAKEEFPLPPLAEQRRIASLLWAVEEVVNKYSNLFEHSRRLLHSCIENAVTYALKHNSFIELDNLVEKNRPVTYGILKPGIGYPGGVPVIKVKDYPNGIINQEYLLLTSPEIDAEYKRSRLRNGDLLISIRGTVGRLAFVPKSLEDANITQDTARLSLDGSVNHFYVRSILESNFVQRQIKSKITGMAVQGINIGELRKIKMPLLTRREQDRVSATIFQIHQSIADIGTHLNRSSALKSQFIESLLV